jgi:hypothetical protein
MIYICSEHGCNYTQNQLSTFKISMHHIFLWNQVRPWKELLEVWDQNGLTSGPTP